MRTLALLLALVFAPLLHADVFLHQYLEQVSTVPHYKQSPEDCAACAAAVGVDIVNARRVFLGELDEFPGHAAPEPIFWGSRVEIGKDKLKKRNGSYAQWVAKWLRDYGPLYQQEYTNGKQTLDLTTYSPKRARVRKRKGVPDWLEPIAKQNNIGGIRKMGNVQDVIKALDAGCPVIVNSSYGFPRKRDAQGFTKPYLDQQVQGPFGTIRTQKRKEWRHTMLFTGYVSGKRPGVVVQTSTSDDYYQEGPNPHNLPKDSWLIDTEYVDAMVRDYYDAYAIGVDRSTEPDPGWVVIVTTKGCKGCQRFKQEMPDGYRWGELAMSADEMRQLGLKPIYPTIVIVEDGESVKTFQGYVPWSTVEPFARKAKQ